MEVAEDNATAGGWGAVGGVGLDDGHCGDEGPGEAAECELDEDPVDGDRFGEGGGSDGDYVAEEHAKGGDGEDEAAAVAVGEGAEARGGEGAEGARYEVCVEHEAGEKGVDFGGLALFVVFAYCRVD